MSAAARVGLHAHLRPTDALRRRLDAVGVDVEGARGALAVVRAQEKLAALLQDRVAARTSPDGTVDWSAVSADILYQLAGTMKGT